MWEKAQEIRINRFHVQIGQDQNASKYLNKYPYSGLLMCMKCGSGFKLSVDIGIMDMLVKELFYNVLTILKIKNLVLKDLLI